MLVFFKQPSQSQLPFQSEIPSRESRGGRRRKRKGDGGLGDVSIFKVSPQTGVFWRTSRYIELKTLSFLQTFHRHFVLLVNPPASPRLFFWINISDWVSPPPPPPNPTPHTSTNPSKVHPRCILDILDDAWGDLRWVRQMSNPCRVWV